MKHDDAEPSYIFDPHHNYAVWLPGPGYYIARMRVSATEIREADMTTRGEHSFTDKVRDAAAAEERARMIASTVMRRH